ncbi:hypothetical protein HMPREF3196_00966 [Bifidobacterium bifidum]|uniref:Uncharacterized protein n=1 Tax=Bifidobacterium bifidum TaxID=1681 RepID=A0A133KPT3_BIFBI|nr:hypothetical protein BIFBIF_00939 [Bifidobacterium bifidum ATCC 29521 = JCM 1255 = DSM 20456]KWZ81502.1 hypothetical protein HMPREF3196_00966 [Bifidobacterium bifidum]
MSPPGGMKPPRNGRGELTTVHHHCDTIRRRRLSGVAGSEEKETRPKRAG